MRQGFSQIGGFISLSLMVYGFLTSVLLPKVFLNKLSLYFLKKKESNEPVENLKEMYDDSKDKKGMIRALRNIFSFENIVWINNQVCSLV